MEMLKTLPGPDCGYTEFRTEQDMDQELKKPFKDLAEAITALARHAAANPMKDDTVSTKISTLEERSNWHRVIGWGIAGIAGALFTGLITWYLPAQLKEVRDGVKSDTAAQILPLQLQLAKLTATATLKESKDVALAIEQSADFSTPRLAIESVYTIAKQARVDKLHTAPSVLQDANAKIQSAVASDPGLVKEGWAATLSLVEYRSSLPVVNSQSSASPKATCPAGFPFVKSIIVDGGVQKLDGFCWKDSTFRNMRIEYDGGLLELENVRFINCTFVMPYSIRSEMFANLILKQNEVSGAVS